MAAGRQGGHRDYEARERELDAEASRRSKEQNHHNHLGGRHRSDADRRRDSGRSRSGREFSNGFGHRRTPPPKSRLSGRLGEREPGEVLSGSASDDSGGRTHTVAENVVSSSSREGKVAPGAAAPSPSKKRKFSPIIWDRDSPKPPLHSDIASGKKVVESLSADTASGTKVVESVSAELPPPPPLPPQGHSPERLVVEKSPMDVDLAVDTEGTEQLHEPEESKVLEEEEYPTMRNISTSRWAGTNDEEEESTAPRKKKNISPADSAELRPGKKTPSPELGEVVVSDISVGRTMSRSSDSGRMGNDEKEDLEVDKYDYMDVDREEASNSDSANRLSSDSENEARRSESPEPVKLGHRCINMLQGCRSVDVFERLNKINEGTYGVVYRARDKKTGEVVALKKVKMEKEREGFPLTSLREINILLSFHHPSIVDVKEVVVGSSLDSIFMVMEYMEHDLKGVMEAKTMKQPYTQSEVKCLMLQLLEGVKYLHDNWVLHRDLKTSNLLLNNRGELKICDFGLSRQYGSPLKPYTQLVVTLWYRAPELLLGTKEYSTAIDMWSVGCIMAELLAKEPLFNGKTEFEQLDKLLLL
ncbi:cyclin-dependent kinase G-2 isoform X2 [Brachypodium distachyon]|uniref:cyclin-dependent kinase G-2 isoform X2 n=1 Tax=Brachypodium distachyon TaxID=15368 RepID=UPI00053001CE|nr:cyclin-dependent kinase G-2 isoform X2 [Brachypodium distachyon]|eukprot:XP_010240051.1 cyclin-dependent kinase G-2 isoform X2 [Brachypodium distachyon]